MHFFKSLFIAVTVSIAVNVSGQTLEVPLITNVSVDKVSQKPRITWSMTDPSTIDGYIIKRQIFGRQGVVDGSYETVATINDPSQFSYLDVSADAILGPAEPGLKPENYRVASFKDVGGGTPQYSLMSEPVATIFLSPIAFDLCLEQNTLNWTAYNGFGENLTGYNIYYSNTLTGAITLVGKVNGDITTFVHEKVEANTTYFYYVEAVDTGNLMANSNIQQITTTMPPLPQVMNADYASVEQDGIVSLSFTLDENAEVNEYLLLKSNTLNGAYDTISSFPNGSGIVTYSDNLSTNEQIAYYKVHAINTCGLPSRATTWLII
ncbi:MAG: fibronectin type III domain-containing protein [Chloroflexia bacterium]|nr:fibronectin type III domain-containing protein [Chloroflexia bacterium]